MGCQEFGATHAREIAEIVSAYAKFNGRRKPELLDPATYSLTNYLEADRIVADFQVIAEKAEGIFNNCRKLRVTRSISLSYFRPRSVRRSMPYTSPPGKCPVCTAGPGQRK